MKILALATVVFISVISVLAGFLIAKIAFLVNENNCLKNYMKQATDKINEARYGNFNVKLESEKDSIGLNKSLNSLFESITDRDLVITEYREKEKENYNLKEEFIAALTHDLKVPIIAQDKTYDLFLQNKFGELNEGQRGVIQKLKESNTDLKEMVNSILETYKIESEGVELKIEQNVNVNEFVFNCVESLKALGESTEKEICFHKGKDFNADFDTFLIKRVINNLIINAIKHSKTTDKIDVHLNQTGDTFSIDVIDYGDGIIEEEIQKIFNKYYSITNKGVRATSGLGLYLSNKIVKKHKGVIEVESKKGEGSIFRIILPVKSVL